ncbi:hypothetical protein SprV_0602138900 [Sparganum proliferum]
MERQACCRCWVSVKAALAKRSVKCNEPCFRRFKAARLGRQRRVDNCARRDSVNEAPALELSASEGKVYGAAFSTTGGVDAACTPGQSPEFYLSRVCENYAAVTVLPRQSHSGEQAYAAQQQEWELAQNGESCTRILGTSTASSGERIGRSVESRRLLTNVHCRQPADADACHSIRPQALRHTEMGRRRLPPSLYALFSSSSSSSLYRRHSILQLFIFQSLFEPPRTQTDASARLRTLNLVHVFRLQFLSLQYTLIPPHLGPPRVPFSSRSFANFNAFLCRLLIHSKRP